MRKVRWLPLVAMFAAFGAQAQELAGVHGTVVHGLTRQPIAGVHINLTQAGHGSMPELAYGATTADTGTFSIVGMKPGSYFMTLKSPGLISVRGQDKGSLASPNLILKAGDNLSNLRLEMKPYAVISGRSATEEGDPVPARIEADLAGGHAIAGWQEFVWAETDDRGMYQLFLPPGKYILKADVSGPNSDEPEEIRTDGTSESSYHAMYFAGVSKKAGATAIDALPGVERTGVDFEFRHTPSLSINGTVSGIPKAAGPVELKLSVFEEGDSEVSYEDTIPVDAEGKFAATHLDPGHYRLYAGVRAGDRQLRTPMREVELAENSVTLDLPLGPGAEFAGKMEPAGGAGTVRGMSVRLESAYSDRGWGPSQIAPVAVDGTFQMSGLQPDRYRVVALPVSPSQYVTVLVDGQPAKYEAVDLRELPAGSRIRIVVSRDGAQITGKMESKGEVQNRALSVIYLFPDGDYDNQALRWRMTGTDGVFSFEGLRPGKYRLLAQDFLNENRFGDGVTLMDAAKTAESIEVHAGEKLVRNAKTPEAADDKK